MSKQPKNLNGVFGRAPAADAAAQLSTEAVGRRNIGNASEPARRTMPATPPEPTPRLPSRALGEYVPGGRVDAPGHTSCSAPATDSASSSTSNSVSYDEGAPGDNRGRVTRCSLRHPAAAGPTSAERPGGTPRLVAGRTPLGRRSHFDLEERPSPCRPGGAAAPSAPDPRRARRAPSRLRLAAGRPPGHAVTADPDGAGMADAPSAPARSHHTRSTGFTLAARRSPVTRDRRIPRGPPAVENSSVATRYSTFHGTPAMSNPRFGWFAGEGAIVRQAGSPPSAAGFRFTRVARSYHVSESNPISLIN